MPGYYIITIAAFLFISLLTLYRLKSVPLRIGNRGRVDFGFMSFISAISYLALLNVIVFAGLKEIGIQKSSLFAAMWLAGLVGGILLKKPILNFFAGMLIRVFLHFKGEETVRHKGESAVILEVKTFETILKLSENRSIFVSNASVCMQYILN